MTGVTSSRDSAITVEGEAYVLKVGGENRPSVLTQDIKWYVVAFPCKLGRPQVPLAGPFESKSEAAKALDTYLDQASHQATCEAIRTFHR